MTNEYKTDAPNYVAEDSGCPEATKHLGYQSNCLNCPFPEKCIQEPGGRRRWLKELRNEEIRRLRIEERKGIAELASMFGIGKGTVQRIIGDYTSD